MARRSTDIVEKMCEAFWNAYRDGYYAAGGKLDYPEWSASRDPVRDETYRCMRHALETLRGVIGDGFTDLAPLSPMSRQDADKLVAAVHAPLIQAIHDAHSKAMN